MPYKDPEKAKTSKHARYEAHKEETRIYNKNYRETHQNSIKEQKKSYYETHKEEHKNRMKAYYKLHKEKIDAQNKTYYESHKEEVKTYLTSYQDATAIEIVCVHCGNKAKVSKYVSGKFCSYECAASWQKGPNAPNWKGGISFEPYCPKFNNDLRERVRAFFDYKCMMCGKSTTENGRALACHHVEYNKNACCDGKPIHFAATCTRCHGKTNHGDRARWEAMLHRCIDEIWGGRSYYTKEEYAALCRVA